MGSCFRPSKRCNISIASFKNTLNPFNRTIFRFRSVCFWTVYVLAPNDYWRIVPFFILSFWVGLGIISVIMVLVMVVIGKEIGDKSFGILLGFFTAISTRSDMSTNLIFLGLLVLLP